VDNGDSVCPYPGGAPSPGFWAHDMTTSSSACVHRASDRSAWERYADSIDAPIITQWDDGQHTGTDAGHTPTSSLSEPRLVASYLTDADIRLPMRVLNADALLRLTVARNGSASGPFVRPREFMELRYQRLDWVRVTGHLSGNYPGDADRSATSHLGRPG